MHSHLMGDEQPTETLKNQLKDSTAFTADLQHKITIHKPSNLKLNPKNPRKHSRRQQKTLQQAMKEYGFTSLVVVDGDLNVICGHARVEAAIKVDIPHIPTIQLSHLSDYQLKKLMILDNRLSDIGGGFDEVKLGEMIIELTREEIEFEPEAIAFTSGEVATYTDKLPPVPKGAADPDDNIPPDNDGPIVSKPGYLWLLANRHRVLCGNARIDADFAALMDGHKVDIIFSDHPYNLAATTISGLGQVKHKAFIEGSGEMTEAEYLEFLTVTCKNIARRCKDGCIVYLCIDFRHIAPMLEAGRIAFTELKNLCIWSKSPGLGSLYRSAYEMVTVWKVGTAKHCNNVEMGKNGRHRTNIWTYPSINNFGRASEEGSNLLHLHPTVKPVRLIADALLDCSNRGEIVADCFLGSGSTVIAAERTGRRCFGMELDPRYVDTTVRRWQAYTREAAVLASTGRTFDEMASEATDVNQ